MSAAAIAAMAAATNNMNRQYHNEHMNWGCGGGPTKSLVIGTIVACVAMIFIGVMVAR